MPPPRIATVFPTPTFAGQSPGRGDVIIGAGGGGGGGAGGLTGAAEDEPQADSEDPMPSAVMARNIAEPPTDRPIALRNSRRPMFAFVIIQASRDYDTYWPPKFRVRTWSGAHGQLSCSLVTIPGVATVSHRNAGRWLVTATVALFVTCGVRAETVTVAVASNFKDTAAALANRFEAQSGHRVLLIPGSSGRLYAQIRNGAPFDIFMSADVERPAQLEQDQLAVPGSRFTYAIGRLVVWSGDAALGDTDCLDILRNPGSNKIAIANPVLAPYGRAASAYLQARGWWEGLQANLVMGENISQTLQFVASGNAAAGLIAQSQLRIESLPASACEYRIPDGAHPPIEQQLVQLLSAAGNPAASDFLVFLRDSQALSIIADHGYNTVLETRP